MESSLDLFAMSAALNAANEEKRFGEVGADQTIAEFQKIIKNHHFSETISQNDLIIEHEQDEKLSVEEFNAKYSKDSDSAKPVCIHGKRITDIHLKDLKILKAVHDLGDCRNCQLKVC